MAKLTFSLSTKNINSKKYLQYSVMSFFIGQWVDWWLGTSFLSVGTGTGKIKA